MAHGSPSRDWHVARARRIMRDHPEIARLQGPPAVTAWLILILAVLQTFAAWIAAQFTWPLVAAAAWIVGTIPALGLFVLLHEGAHGLILRNERGNRTLMIIATAPLLLPWAPGFKHYHLEHHCALGVIDRDADAPSPWETAMTGSRHGRLLWLAAWPLIQFIRLPRCRPHRTATSFFAVNLAFNCAFITALFAAGGLKAIGFCALSVIFAFGFHPLGGRMLQEHVTAPAGQPSASYYGWGNRLLFNAGYHVEHHDFMQVPWIHLPAVRRLAASEYVGLTSYRSWTALAAMFVWRGAQPDSGTDRTPPPLARRIGAKPVGTAAPAFIKRSN